MAIFLTGSTIFIREKSPQPSAPNASGPSLNTAIAHLRDVLGDQTYESLAREGATMTAAMATYAYDQIDQARAELDAVSKLGARQGRQASRQGDAEEVGQEGTATSRRTVSLTRAEAGS